MASSFEDIKGDPTRQALGSLQGYRRHITLAAKTMVHQLNRDELDRSDELAAAAADAERLPYLTKEFWARDKRILFVSTPELLSKLEAERIDQGISARRNGIAGKKVPWRTIIDAEDDLRSLYDDPSYSIENLRAIGEWVSQMKGTASLSNEPAFPS